MRGVLSDDKGLTLIETLVTLAIMASIAGVLVSFQWVTLTQWRSGDNQAELQQSVRLGVNRMTRVARVSYDVKLNTNGRLYFFYRESGLEKVTYYYAAGGVLYEVTTNNNQLTWGTTQAALYIQRLDQSYDTTRKLVSLTLRGQAADGQQFNLQTEVRPRLVN